MHVVLMGCGRVGSTMARALDKHDHSVAIIDLNADSFRRLPPSFGGTTVKGTGFDRGVLIKAGIEHADAFAAVSSGDNSNIIAARVVRESFGVENVIARIYDPGRAEVYQRLGIATVGTVRWTVAQMMRRILPEGSLPEYRDTSGKVQLCEVHHDPAWIGQRALSIEPATGARLAYLTRLGEGMLPTKDTILQEGDRVHLLVDPTELKTIEGVLAAAPEEA